MMRGVVGLLALLMLPLAGAKAGETWIAKPATVTEWKAVFARVEARDSIPARARLGGTLVSVGVSEGDHVEEGQPVASIVDEKLTLKLSAIDTRFGALNSQLKTAQTELERGEELLKRGVTTAQRLDALRTQVDVIASQIETTKADRRIVEEQAAEGTVLAPLAGRVLTVPVTSGSVILPGEVVANVGGGGFVLRLAVPERHAGFMREGAAILIGGDVDASEGTLSKIYPQIEEGRVIADVEVGQLDDTFVGARVLVRLPVGEREAMLVPASAVETRNGLDFIEIQSGDETSSRTVVLGAAQDAGGERMHEVLSGLAADDVVVLSHE